MQTTTTLEDKGRRQQQIWAYASLGVGVACGLTGWILYRVGKNTGEEAYDAYMAATTQEDMDRHWDDVASADTKVITSYVLIGLAVGAVGLSLYHFVTMEPEPRRSSSRSQVRVHPLPGGVGFSWSGQF